ncbi:MAG: hypothetical protein WC346_14650 [Methanogenium sp.]|jgi:hypothetical protein
MANTTPTLIPNYLDMDFATTKANLTELLAQNPVFANYRVNAEGNNITILIELIAYLNQLTTYYANMIAKNQFLSTADLYETVHMLAKHSGYNPQGYRSSNVVVNVTIDGAASAANLNEGDVLNIPAWKRMYCTELSHPLTGDVIQFANMMDQNVVVASTGTLTTSISAREGVVTALTYHGSDIESDYRIYLPLETYDYGDDIENGVPCISLYVAGKPFSRITDFYDNLSGLTDNNDVFMLNFDKYQRYYLEFSAARSVPKNQDEILVGLLKSSGTYGNIPSAAVNKPESQFVYNVTTSEWIDNSYITITNPDYSYGGAGMESINEIKNSAIGTYHSQYRNVNREDYITHLESRADVIKATVWGEQDISVSGSTAEYNKIHISLIPSLWGNSTITVSAAPIDGVIIPLDYSHSWKQQIMTYLEPRKIITTYEEFELPDLVYVSFIIGLKVRINYDYSAVEAAVQEKLIYYMDSTNRNFHDIISYTDITDYIMDFSQESETNDFANVKGLQVFTLRDIICDNNTFKEYGLGQYPQYMALPEEDYDNRIRRIQLAYNQFPMLNRIWTIREY